jgi:hypothetical protein
MNNGTSDSAASFWRCQIPNATLTASATSSSRESLTIILHVAVDEAQGAAPSDLSCFGGKAIAFVALEAVISVIGVDLDRRLLRLDRLDVAHRSGPTP